MSRALAVAAAVWQAIVLFGFTWTMADGFYGDAVGWLLFGSLPTLLWLNHVTNPERL